MITTNPGCRLCKKTDLTKVLAVGPSPIANAFLLPTEANKPEPTFPLDVYLCAACGLVQLRDVVSPDVLFRDYLYVSSTSNAFVAHFKQFADTVISKFAVTPNSLVIDVGSNDGILLKPFKTAGMKVLGIDPATKIAAQATTEGIETLPEFLTQPIAKKIVAERGQARVVTANNVFAHVNDLDELTKAIRILLADDGIFTMEAAYLGDFLEKNLFDSVYHEHLCYYGLKPLVQFFPTMGMEVFHVEQVSSHGGSLRVFVQKKNGPQSIHASVKELLAQEEKKRIYDLTTYKAYSARIGSNKEKLKTLLASLKAQGKTIVGYGAPAKSTTLLNYFGIGKETLHYVVDDSPWKQGRLTPGTHIPIVPFEKLKTQTPDYVLILAWNFAQPIIEKLAPFKQSGMKCIVPVPEPTII